MRVKQKLGLVLAATSVLWLSGCVVSVNDGDWDSDSSPHWSKVEKENRQQLEKINVGMSLETVFALMGTADFNELHQQDDRIVQVLFFRTQHRESDGETSKDECTPVVLVDGQVAGWGQTALGKAIQL
ncbi:DUF3192 domain-containing protein [uncultured Ferrimonas sp.]|uniref:DUF3192 domain-containing protein n=1 Tax=uncultured Ferrimonas sp. TaxID=432640 RepID=UPI002635B8BB|nr:DUF3192 domain-containing protein [uncultured Ferrimonas sp.]